MIIKVLALSWKRHKIVLTSLLPDYLVLTVSKFSQQLLFFVMIFTFAVPLLEMILLSFSFPFPYPLSGYPFSGLVNVPQGHLSLPTKLGKVTPSLPLRILWLCHATLMRFCVKETSRGRDT